MEEGKWIEEIQDQVKWIPYSAQEGFHEKIKPEICLKLIYSFSINYHLFIPSLLIHAGWHVQAMTVVDKKVLALLTTTPAPLAHRTELVFLQ